MSERTFVKPTYTGPTFKYESSSDTMTVKSLYTNEKKTIKRPSIVLHRNMRVDGLIQDDRIKPKQNYSHVDELRVDIHASKGPDEVGEKVT